MAGAGSCCYGDGGTFCEGEGGGVDVEDADYVGPEVGDEEVLVRGIETHLMGVRCRLLGLGTRFACEVEVLDLYEGAVGRVEFPRRQCPGVVRDRHQLRAVKAGVDGRVDGSDRDDLMFDRREAPFCAYAEGVERAVAVDDAFVEAVEVLVLDVDLEPGCIGATASGGGGEVSEVVGTIVCEFQGGDVACVGGDVELCGRDGNGQRRDSECRDKHGSVLGFK